MPKKKKKKARIDIKPVDRLPPVSVEYMAGPLETSQSASHQFHPESTLNEAKTLLAESHHGWSRDRKDITTKWYSEA